VSDVTRSYVICLIQSWECGFQEVACTPSSCLRCGVVRCGVLQRVPLCYSVLQRVEFKR